MLVDAHVHLALNHLFSRRAWESAGRDKRTAWLREILREYKRRGICILRDGGDAYFVSELAREIAREEGMIYKTPIYALYKKGRYGSFLGKPIADRRDFKREFKLLLDHGADHLKIILTGLVNFNKYGDVGGTSFGTDELQYMVDAAGEHGLPVMVHANGEDGVAAAVAAGVHTLEHGYLISQAQIYGMAEKGIVWVPTLSPLGNILQSGDSRFSAKEREIIGRVYSGQVENIRKAVEMGVCIALGSDAGASAVHHGEGLLNEIEHLQKIGFDRRVIEKMCLENGARALKIDQHSTG
jgi:predicted amidohydrolase YtcJ